MDECSRPSTRSSCPLPWGSEHPVVWIMLLPCGPRDPILVVLPVVPFPFGRDARLFSVKTFCTRAHFARMLLVTPVWFLTRR